MLAERFRLLWEGDATTAAGYEEASGPLLAERFRVSLSRRSGRPRLELEMNLLGAEEVPRGVMSEASGKGDAEAPWVADAGPTIPSSRARLLTGQDDAELAVFPEDAAGPRVADAASPRPNPRARL